MKRRTRHKGWEKNSGIPQKCKRYHVDFTKGAAGAGLFLIINQALESYVVQNDPPPKKKKKRNIEEITLKS